MHTISLSDRCRCTRLLAAALLAAAAGFWLGPAHAAPLDRLTLIQSAIQVVLDSDQAGTRARNLYEIYDNAGQFDFTTGRQDDRFGGTFASGAVAERGGTVGADELQEAALYWSLTFRVERTSDVHFRASRHLDMLAMTNETVSAFWSSAIAQGGASGRFEMAGVSTPIKIGLERYCNTTPTQAADSCLVTDSLDSLIDVDLGTLAAGQIITLSGYHEAFADARIDGCGLVFCGATATATADTSLHWELTAVPEAGGITLFGAALAALIAVAGGGRRPARAGRSSPARDPGISRPRA